MKKILVVLWAVTAFCGYGWASPLVVINEFLADPPAGPLGDANQDGIRSASDDEFVELLNIGATDVDLGLWSLWDSAALRHQFQLPVLLHPQERLAVFGGGNLINFQALAFVASSGSLNLNNSGDGVILKNALGNIVDSAFFGTEGNRDQSLTRFPEGGGSFQLHASISSRGLPFSPGTDIEGNRSGNHPVVPEPNSSLIVLAGLFILGEKLRRRLKSE